LDYPSDLFLDLCQMGQHQTNPLLEH